MANNFWRENLRPLMFILITGCIFSLSYAIHSDMSGLWSRTENLATLRADWPYKPRFLLAWVAYHLVSVDTLNGVGFRALVAFLAWTATLLLFPKFLERLQVSEKDRPYVAVAFLLIMLAHYCLPNIAAPYYIYDLPAIPFYLIVFVLLTSDELKEVFIGAALLFLFYLNRESISVALFHAAAWKWAKTRNEGKPIRSEALAFIVLAATFLGSLALRQVLLNVLNGNPKAIFLATFYEDGHVRFIANLLRVLNEWGSRQQFMAIGFGFVLYAPFAVRQQNLRVKAVLGISIVPLLPALILGNFTELRIYNEFIPIVSCILATFIRTASHHRYD